MKHLLLPVLACLSCSSAEQPEAPQQNPPPRVAYSFQYGPEVVLPGEEGVKCLDFTSPDSDAWIRGWHARLNFVHHVNIARRTAGTPFKTPSACSNGTNGIGVGVFGVTQPDVTEFLDEAPEYEGASIRMPKNADLIWDVHYLNTGDKPIEATVDIDFFEAESEHRISVSGFSLAAAKSLVVPPMTTKTLTYTYPPPAEDLAIMTMTAHVHAHNVGTSFRVNGQEVYRSTDWTSPLVKRFDSLHGGALVIHPADKIEWSCEIQNTSSVALRWANEVNTGEMCIVFGRSLGPSWSTVVP